jgi:hypothetical protein
MSGYIDINRPSMEVRPACPGCQRKLAPSMWWADYDPTSHLAGEPIKRKWYGLWDGYGAFCTLRCAARYANYMYAKYGTRTTT